jgi:hypothetical protein
MGVTSDPAARAGKAKARTTSNIAMCIFTSLSLRSGQIRYSGRVNGHRYDKIASRMGRHMRVETQRHARARSPGSQPHTRLSVSRDTVPHVP